MKLIDLCQYTLRQSLCDEGDYFKFYTVEEIIKNLNKKEVKNNGRTKN